MAQSPARLAPIEGFMSTTFKVNGRQHTLDALPETPLLWIICLGPASDVA
jgi:hypothetical protein